MFLGFDVYYRVKRSRASNMVLESWSFPMVRYSEVCLKMTYAMATASVSTKILASYTGVSSEREKLRVMESYTAHLER
jgi:hypothetical protein